MPPHLVHMFNSKNMPDLLHPNISAEIRPFKKKTLLPRPFLDIAPIHRSPSTNWGFQASHSTKSTELGTSNRGKRPDRCPVVVGAWLRKKKVTSTSIPRRWGGSAVGKPARAVFPREEAERCRTARRVERSKLLETPHRSGEGSLRLP